MLPSPRRLIFLVVATTVSLLLAAPLSARTLTLISPNGGEWFEPGEVVQIQWTFSGSDWQAGDTIKIEYSANGGGNWTKPQGGNRVAYNAGVFAWDTSGRDSSTAYRVRITSNNGTASDQSDSSFTISADYAAPVIVHTPLTDTGYTTGPYPVSAQITDNHGIASAVVYWSKNGGAYIPVPMTPSGSTYSGNIPGPGAIGDEFRYYIQATDTAAASNVARSPSTAPASPNSFVITTCALDVAGNATLSSSNPDVHRCGNIYYCSAGAKLMLIKQYLNVTTAGEMIFYVYESTSRYGQYVSILQKSIGNPGTSEKLYESGPISVYLHPGRYYIIGAAWQGAATTYYAAEDSATTVFGRWVNSYKEYNYPPPSWVWGTPYSGEYYQRLSSCLTPRDIFLTKPNGGEWFEAGNTVRVEWTTTGPWWKTGDTIKLEYSTNGGASWTPIPGAASVPYNAGGYDWNTTGVASSATYRVRATFNGDASVNDSVNGDFTIQPDTAPPVITHTPVNEDARLTGPYTIAATVTDNKGVASVTVKWRKNGGPLNWMAMNVRGSGNEYAADIPGPGVIGDHYCYYIEAVDSSYAGNVARSPAGAPTTTNCLNIARCGVDETTAGYWYFPDDNFTCGNVYYCSTDSEITQIEQRMSVPASTELRFCVNEATSLVGPFVKIAEKVVPNSGVGDFQWFSSGPMSAKMRQGYYYLVSTGSLGQADFMADDNEVADTTAFGQLVGGDWWGYPLPWSVYYSDTGWSFHQRLSSCRISRALTVLEPNGGSVHQPGSVINVQWRIYGIDWSGGDAVRLDYSTDSGTTWTFVGSNFADEYINWNTTGCPDSEHYRIRLTYTNDTSVTDMSDADFVLRTDTQGPMIIHSALGDTTSLINYRSVQAHVTDANGVASTKLYWKKNGSQFTEVDMPLTTGGDCSANISTLVGLSDVICYYIEATDASLRSNVSRWPASAPGQPQCYTILPCATDTVTCPYVRGTSATMVGNAYTCSTSTVINQIEQQLVLESPSEMRFAVYEAPAQTGAFDKIFETTVQASPAGLAWYGSGPINVKLTKGRYYYIGTAVQGPFAYYDSPPQSSAHFLFGVGYAGSAIPGYPSPAVATATTGLIHSQRISFCRLPRDITLYGPNGGQMYQPGESVLVTWNASGPNWQPSDTLRLEYSTDGGATWTGVPGASALAYNANSYSWNTTGCPPSEQCRVKLTCNQDESVFDSSDSDFGFRVDTIAPVITHTPLADTSMWPGPHNVQANVTDVFTGVGTVKLYWSRNGGAFSSVTMSGGPTYYGEIRGPSVVGDVYDYYIEARDRAVTPNVARSPASGTYQFTITQPLDRHTEEFGYGQFDLSYRTIIFAPDASPDGYGVSQAPAITLPTDPTGGISLAMGADSYRQVLLPPGQTVRLYGQNYTSFYVCSNGSITFASGDPTSDCNISYHFERQRISGLFCRLHPGAGGSISYKTLADRVAVTYLQVPEYGTSNLNTFQIDLRYDGRIMLTCLAVSASKSIVGLSSGGNSRDFLSSDLSKCPQTAPCGLGVSDSIAPTTDKALPFGELQIGSSRTEHVTLSNPTSYSLLVRDARIALYHEDFDDGLAQGWTEYTDSDWSVQNGQYVMGGDGGNAMYSGAEFTDFYYEVRHRQLFEADYQEIPAWGISFRAAPPGPAGLLTQYYFGIENHCGLYRLYAYKSMNGAGATFYSALPTFVNSPEQWNTLAVNAVGPTLQFYANGHLITTATDYALGSGRIGIYGSGLLNCRHYFDDILVTPPLGTTSGNGYSLSGLLPTMPFMLAPFESCTFDVTYNPQRMEYAPTTLLISSSDASQANTEVNLTGAAYGPDSIHWVKQKEDGTPVAVKDMVVSAVFADRFYIQTRKRTGGIGVLWTGSMPEAGDVVSVGGCLVTDNAVERMVQATSVAVTGHQDEPKPIGMSQPQLGGKDYMYASSPRIRGQIGVYGGKTLNNIGLLVCTIGQVTQIGSGYIYVDDGSGIKDGSFTGTEQNKGVKILCDPTGRASGEFVKAVGICSCFKLTGTQVRRRIVTRGSEDIIHIQ